MRDDAHLWLHCLEENDGIVSKLEKLFLEILCKP